MMRITWKPATLLLFLTLTLTGCSSITMVASWRDKSAPARSYGKLLVVGITENGQMRQLFEEVMAAELRKKGVIATPSYLITGMKEKQSRESLEKAVKKTGADAVITTRVTGRKRSTDTHVGYVMTDRGFANPYLNNYYDVMPNDLYGFYGASVVAYATFDMKSVEVTTSTTSTLETNLFDTATGKLIWSGTTTMVDPEGLITASKKFAGVTITALSKEGMIP
jgi:hypothetical protein